MPKPPDDNDKLVAGQLPDDPSTGTGKLKLRVVEPNEKAQTQEAAAIETERALLGALLWAGAHAPDTLRVRSVLDILPNSAAFYDRTDAAIYDAIRACESEKCEHDPVAVYVKLQHTDYVRRVGGLDGLRALKAEASTVSETQARHYATQMVALYARRAAVNAAYALLEQARNPKSTFQSISESAQLTASSISSSVSGIAVSVSAKEAANGFFTLLQAGGKKAVSTGLRDLDAALNGGFRPGEVTILGARVNIGKSLLSAQIAKHIVSTYSNSGVLYVSLEMSHEAFVSRMVSSDAGVPLSDLRRAKLSPDQWTAVTASVARFAELGLYFVDSPVQTMSSVYNAALERSRLLTREGKHLDLVVIDHIGLIKPSAESTKKMSREGQVAETSRAQRFLASKLGCHVLGIAQISRAAEAKGVDGMPRLHHLRESGSIEADADTVLILHRERVAKTGLFCEKKPPALAVAKGRLDETAVMLLSFNKEHARFSDWTEFTTFSDYYGY